MLPPARGKCVTTPADSTPGSFVTSSTSLWTKAPRSAPLGYRTRGSESSIVSTFRGLNPGLTRRRRTKLWIVSAAPISRTSASAISETTSPLRRRLRCSPPAEPREPSWSASVRLPREACSAGASPKSSAARIEMTSVKPSTRPSTPMSPDRGMLCGIIAASASRPQRARSTPAAPAHAASRRLSTSNCRTRAARVAPSAARIDISRCRAVARTSKRFATLPHAADDLIVQGDELDARADVVLRVALLDAPFDGVHLGARLLDRDARPEAADRLQPVIGALREVFWIQRQRDPQLSRRIAERVEYDAGASRKIEAARHHAYDREAAAVYGDRPADDSWIAAESSAPQSVAEDGHLIPAGLLLLRQKETALDGIDAERR